VMLPELSGLELCRTLKGDSRTRNIPIIMLTAKAQEIDRVVGLELGADDYVTKPFSPRELVLRVKSQIRRSQGGAEEPADTLRSGDLAVDKLRHSVTVKGKPVLLTATEFKLISLLLERPGRVQTRETLLNEVWGYDVAIQSRTVDIHVRRLREKLGRASDCIETVRGFGYRVVEAH
jgi:DNA-binding response OmpR family regulator